MEGRQEYLLWRLGSRALSVQSPFLWVCTMTNEPVSSGSQIFMLSDSSVNYSAHGESRVFVY